MQCCCLRHPFTSSVRADSCARLLSRGIAKLIRQADDDEKYNQESHADGAIADEYAAMEAEEAGAPASAMAAATGEVLEVGIILYPLTHPLPPHTPPSLPPYPSFKVGIILYRNHEAINSLYTYFACSSKGTAAGDLHGFGFNAW